MPTMPTPLRRLLADECVPRPLLRALAELNQHTVPYPIGVVILEMGNSDFEELLPHVAAVKAAIETVEAGTVMRIGGARVRERAPAVYGHESPRARAQVHSAAPGLIPA